MEDFIQTVEYILEQSVDVVVVPAVIALVRRVCSILGR